MSVMLLDPPTLQIRGARLSDAARITRCYLASRQTMLPYAPLPHTDDQVLAWVSDLLLPTGGLTVALESGAVVGFIATAERAGSQWVDQLYVHPTRLRRGVGSTLLHLALARWQGPVRLYCFEPNKVARRFYEHFGFVAIGFGDGSNNESRCPDVLYERSPDRG
ncbi:MAG: GNAT family N-acetyltransferase [Rubrivivax sp.]|nr:GNAT family N-acetyltransferase [Rubrivivax sp.]